MIVVTIVAIIVHYLLQLYLAILFARVILDLLRAVARSWRPHGFLLVITELVYTLTDPPIRAARKIVKPVQLGGMSLDLAFSVVVLVVIVLNYVATVVASL